MTDTPRQVIPMGTPQGGDTHEQNKDYSGALDPQLAELNDAVAYRVDATLTAFGFAFSQLRRALEAHAISIEEGTLEHRELGGDLRQFLPILTATLQQENKVHETIEQRVGKAGKYALDLDRARFEIHGRLSSINGAARRERVPEQPE